MQEVGGSIPPGSTSLRSLRELGQATPRPIVAKQVRDWGPPFHGEDAGYFVGINRNKRSIYIVVPAHAGTHNHRWS